MSEEIAVHFTENKGVLNQIGEIVINSESVCSSGISLQQQYIT